MYLRRFFHLLIKRTVRHVVQRRIEFLRKKLIEMTEETGSFTDDNVICISRMLDRYIILYHKMKKRKKCSAYNPSFYLLTINNQ